MIGGIIAVTATTITIAVIALSSFSSVQQDTFAAFPIHKLNNFYVTNETTGKHIFMVVGQFMNNGTLTEPEVDISLTLFNNQSEIIGVSHLYNYDVKVGDLIPFRFKVNPVQVENNNFSNIDGYTVIVE